MKTIFETLTPCEVTELAKNLFANERSLKRLDGWFRILEIEMNSSVNTGSKECDKAEKLKLVAQMLPLEIDENAVFAGTQRDAFARSYALINPTFKVEEFSGYCDPTAVFNDIEPNDEFTSERIQSLRERYAKTDYVSSLSKVYEQVNADTREVAYFIEQVTGHLIPDFRNAIKNGIGSTIQELDGKDSDGHRAMKSALESVLILAKRYKSIAKSQLEQAKGNRRAVLESMVNALERVPEKGARNLYEAIQSFILLWQMMCVEQAPNPFAFSVGNADRIFAPYMNGLSREEAASLFKHFLVFFNVTDRSWAISQNIIIGGRDIDGSDLTNPASFALLDAYYDMNLPQPILSVKLHKNTPDTLYRELGRFFFTPGVLTPSLFNDDSLFEVLGKHGIDKEDLPDISIAGCQEPLIMGKDNGNTTNSWLNLAKILELTLTGGRSLVTGERLRELDKAELCSLRESFYKNAGLYIEEMTKAANGASRALSNLRVPFLSCFMGGLESGVDLRDVSRQGTKYNGSGCLIHGLTVVADSFAAIDALLAERPQDAQRLLPALESNFETDPELHAYLKKQIKFGNNIPKVDDEASTIARRISTMVRQSKNYLGNSFRPDFSTPSTHLLYGYWVGATPDGRKSREMLGYGVDPLYGDASNGLGFRVLSSLRLPYDEMNGGYASHLGVDPKYFRASDYEGKGEEFKNKIISPLFFNSLQSGVSPFYLYVNVTTPETLRKVLENPKKYAPSGVYIMRIHGTFVNFLDLSPAIQQDIIKRLDPCSACLAN